MEGYVAREMRAAFREHEYRRRSAGPEKAMMQLLTILNPFWTVHAEKKVIRIAKNSSETWTTFRSLGEATEGFSNFRTFVCPMTNETAHCIKKSQP